MSIEYIGVKIKATTYGDFPDNVKEITHADIQFNVPCDVSKEKKFEKAKDNLLQAVIDVYALEDQQQVDVTIEYEYFGVNNQ
jgi:SHS2 domain-containing protein